MRETLQVIQKACDLADRLLLEQAELRDGWADKSDRDPVTKADLLIEETLTQKLSSLGVPVYGEESGKGDLRQGEWWLIDPIDGTANWTLGSPWCGSMISLLRDGKPAASAMTMPFLKERYWAAAGDGCFRLSGGEESRVLIPEAPALNQASIVLPDLWQERVREPIKPITELMMLHAYRYRVVGAAVMEAHLVLSGQAHGRVHLVDPAYAYDNAALLLCFQEAGLINICQHGNPVGLFDDDLMISAPAVLAEEIRALL